QGGGHADEVGDQGNDRAVAAPGRGAGGRGPAARAEGAGRPAHRHHRHRPVRRHLDDHRRRRLGQRQEVHRGRQPRRQGLRGAQGRGHRRHRRRSLQGHRRPGDQPADQDHQHRGPAAGAAALTWKGRLRPARRSRPGGPPPRREHRMRVAIIGSGFAGVSTALQLLARGAEVALLDGSELRGRGIAYGRARPHHLLNVPADRMGLDPGDAGAFADWLGLSGGARSGFRPRAEYGRYLLDRLQAARREHGPALQVVDEDAHSLQRDDTGWRLHTNAGTTLQADAVVIAVGAPASSPARGATPAGVVADPWQPGALDGIAPDAEVLIVGTGLTMADLVLTLDSRNHRGRIVAISRRGLLPRPHPADGVVPQPLPEAAMTALEQGRLASAVRGFRCAAAAGAAPEALVAALRGHTARAWRGWPLAVRQRFLRHLRPWWDTVRHRIPAQVAAELERLRARGRLEIAAARLEALSVDAGGVRATLRRRRSASAEAR